jgi:hypothetical protein
LNQGRAGLVIPLSIPLAQVLTAIVPVPSKMDEFRKVVAFR